MNFRSAQVNLYSMDLPRAVAFYVAVGFEETFRYPSVGEAEHVELMLDGFTLGIATVETTIANHGFAPDAGGKGMELVLWTDDVDAAVVALVGLGATPLSPAHDWLSELRLAWVADPDGHPIQVVQKGRSTGAP